MCRKEDYQFENNYRMSKANIPTLYRNKRLSDFKISDEQYGEQQSQIKEEIQNFIINYESEKEKHKGFIFYGSCGTGKTYLSTIVCNELIHRYDNDVYYTEFYKEINKIKDLFGDSGQKVNDRWELFCNKEFLVIDEIDIGGYNKSEWYSQMLFDLINSRINRNKQTILITNLSDSQLRNTLGSYSHKILDRLKLYKKLSFNFKSQRDL